MGLWGEGWKEQQLGFGCRETAKQGIDRTEYCCRNAAPSLPPTASKLLSVRSPLCLRCAVSTASESNSDSRVLCPHCLIWTQNGEVICRCLKFSQRYSCWSWIHSCRECRGSRKHVAKCDTRRNICSEISGIISLIFCQDVMHRCDGKEYSEWYTKNVGRVG